LEVKATTNNVITNTWKVLDAASTHEYYCVLLEVVAFAADICPHFVAVSKSNARYFTQGRVWFFRCFSGDLNTDASFKRCVLFIVGCLEVVGYAL
jgi:hypothetical protein